jgi:hypothetical protein
MRKYSHIVVQDFGLSSTNFLRNRMPPILNFFSMPLCTYFYEIVISRMAKAVPESLINEVLARRITLTEYYCLLLNYLQTFFVYFFKSLVFLLGL